MPQSLAHGTGLKAAEGCSAPRTCTGQPPPMIWELTGDVCRAPFPLCPSEDRSLAGAVLGEPFPHSHLICLGFHPSVPQPEPTSHTRHLPSLPCLQASLAREPVLQCAGQMGVPDTRAADLWP